MKDVYFIVSTAEKVGEFILDSINENHAYYALEDFATRLVNLQCDAENKELERELAKPVWMYLSEILTAIRELCKILCVDDVDSDMKSEIRAIIDELLLAI